MVNAPSKFLKTGVFARQVVVRTLSSSDEHI